MERKQLMRNISSQIYIHRNDKGLTQGELAKLVDVSRPHINDWENRKYMPSAFMLCNLADIFDCTVDELLGRTSDGKGRV